MLNLYATPEHPNGRPGFRSPLKEEIILRCDERDWTSAYLAAARLDVKTWEDFGNTPGVDYVAERAGDSSEKCDRQAYCAEYDFLLPAAMARVPTRLYNEMRRLMKMYRLTKLELFSDPDFGPLQRTAWNIVSGSQGY